MWVDRRKQRRPSQAERLVVYTAIFGEAPDGLKSPGKLKTDPGVAFVCFSDRKYLGQEGTPWQVRPPLWSGTDPRRSVGYHKVLSHLAFPDAHYSLWLDANVQLTRDPWSLVKLLTRGVEVAAFKHPHRDCVYDELEALARLGRVGADSVRRQVEGYRGKGYPVHQGLADTCVLLRRHSPKVREFNRAWWGEIEAGSPFDGLSFDFVIWSRKMRYGLLKGEPDRSPDVRRVNPR